MAQVIVTAEREVAGSVEQVRAALADYVNTRPKILTTHFSDYSVRSGGHGAGSQVRWKLAPTEKRVRDQLMNVTEPGDGSLVESDANSSMVTTWTVRPARDGHSTVGVRTTWNGASGVGGFFERIFAPMVLRRIYIEMLNKLDGELGHGAAG
jgi:hypothetical protein